jgi:hypothetical protein
MWIIIHLMSIKDFLMRKMLASKMKDVPVADQEKIFSMLEKNPELFQNIAVEVQSAMKNGKDQMTATMEVMQKYKDELTKISQ